MEFCDNAIETAWHDDIGEQQVDLLALQLFECPRRPVTFKDANTRQVLGMCLSAIHSNTVEGRRGFGVFRM